MDKSTSSKLTKTIANGAPVPSRSFNVTRIYVLYKCCIYDVYKIYAVIGWNMQPLLLSLNVGDENWKLYSLYGNHTIFSARFM